MNATDEHNIENPYFTRSPRIIGAIPLGELEIEGAPNLGQKPEINWLSVLLPSLCMVMIMAAMVWLMPLIMNNNMAFYSPFMFIFSGSMMIISMITSIVNYRSQIRRFKRKEALRIEKYEAYLESQREYLDEKSKEQRAILNGIHLEPVQCLDVVRGRKRRLWERMPSDDDFMSLRIGIGETPSTIKIKTPKVGITLEEDDYLYSPQKIAEEFNTVSDVPIVCDFMRYQGCGVVGRYDLASSLARSMVVQAATNHGYDELRIIGVFSASHENDWKWLRFLPHVFDRSHMKRYLSFGEYQSRELLQSIESELKLRMDMIQENSKDDVKQKIPYYLILTDDISLLINQPIMTIMLDRGHEIGVGHIIISDRLSGIHRSTTQIIQTDTRKNVLYIKNNVTEYIPFIPDTADTDMCDELARAMAPIRLSIQEGSKGSLPDQVTFMTGYGINKPNDLDLSDLWENVRPEESMLVPIAIDTRGETFYFDINEKAHGPHGLVAGTTGSGKSEMIQSWILSMAIQFSPQDVSFVLIDFKGTGLIQPFLNLPHLAGKISDIDTDIGRNLIALRAELQRRKKLFDRAGTNNISGYLKLYRAGKVKESLSYLFVVIDEYAEFKSNFPDFTAEINSLFRTGRALGVHIILLTQNPEGVISGESESNVRFRWCLKVANAAASKEILGGHIEAAQITEPGRAYVRIGEDDIFEQVQSFYSGAPYHPDSQKKRVEVNRIDISGKKVALTSNVKSFEYGKEIDVLIKYICEYTERKQIPSARQIWTEQLPAPIYLHHDAERKDEQGNIFPVVGLLDDPENQKQYPFTLPLSAEGHVVIHGGPGSGKTTFLQTLIMSLCTKYTPDIVNIYIMDFGSWGMGIFRDFPHIGGVANSNEDTQIKNMEDLLETILDERKRLFARDDIKVGSIQSYNRMGRENLPYIVLAIDNFTPVLQIFPQMEQFFTKLTREGGSYGMYLVATSSSSTGLGFKLQQNVKTKVALQMTDSTEYVSIVGKTGGILPKNIPGRGLYRDGKVMEFQTALPAASEDEATRGALIREAAIKQKDGWNGKRPKTLKTMPEIIPYGSIPMNEGFALGLSTKDVEPVYISKEIPHTLLISGASGSGITNLLRVLIQQMNKQSDSRILVYGNEDEYKDILKPKDIVTCRGDVIDGFLSGLSEEMQRRKKLKDYEDENSNDPVYILVDGFKMCVDIISQDSLNRLNAISQIGEGLGVMLVIADSMVNLNPLKGYVPVLNKMAERQIVVLGGRPSDHLMINVNIPSEERREKIGDHQGVLIRKNEYIKLKFMKADREE